MLNSVNFSFPRNVLVLERQFCWVSNSKWFSFSFSTLEFYLLLYGFHVNEQLAIILVCILCGWSLFFVWLFLRSDWLFCTFIIMRIKLDFYLFIWIRIHWSSRTWGFEYFINYRKSLVNICLNRASFWYSHLIFRYSV